MNALSPYRVRRPAPNSLLDDMQARNRGRVRDQAAVWLREYKRSNPAHYRQVARRHVVLSTYQIDRRKAVEVAIEQEVPSHDGALRSVAALQVFIDWQRVRAALQ